MINEKEIIISKGPYMDFPSISKVNISSSFMQDIDNKNLLIIANNLSAPKKYACIKDEENKNTHPQENLDIPQTQEHPTIELPKTTTNNEKIEDILSQEKVTIKDTTPRLNTSLVVFMNKKDAYVGCISNEKLTSSSKAINNILLSKPVIKEEPLPSNNKSNSGYINFTLLLISTTFLSILSFMLGLLILGK